MFSQPTIKRTNLSQPYIPMHQMQSNLPIYNQNNIDFNANSFQNMNMSLNDNMSHYSSASTATSLTNNLKRKNIMDEFNSILNNCMDSLLPKIAEECSNLVFSKISSELEKQSKEIEELKVELSKLETCIKNKLNHKIFDTDSTPYRNIRQVNGDLGEINSLMADQSVVLKEMKLNANRQEENSYQSIFDCLNKKIHSLKDHVEEERKIAEKINSGIRDRYVDLLGVKNIIDDKINYLINDVRVRSTNESRSNENLHSNQFKESEKNMIDLIEIVDILYERISSGNLNQNNKKEYYDLELIPINRERIIFDGNKKNNHICPMLVTPISSKMNNIKDNFNHGNCNSSNTINFNSNMSATTSNMTDIKSSNKAKNLTINPITSTARKTNKRINFANKFTF